MRDVLQSTARKFKIYMADAADPTAGLTGLSSFSVYLAKDNGAENAVSPSITERGHGWYEVTPITAHRDTLGENAWTFIHAGAIDFPYKETVVLYDAQLAAVGANTVAPATPTNVSDAQTNVLARLPNDLAADGSIKASLSAILGTALTEGAGGRLAAAMVKWFNVATPTGTVNSLPDAVAGDAGGVAIVGSEMGLTTAVLTALFSDTDTAALVDAIIARVESDLDGADLSTAAIAVAVRDAILNRILAGNHDTAGTVGKVLQFLDVLLSTRATPAQVTAALDTISATALARFATVDTLQVSAAAGSVAKLAQGSGGSGGAGDAEQATLLDVQSTVDALAAGLAGVPVRIVDRVSGGTITAFVDDDYRDRSDTPLELPVSDPGGILHTKLAALGVAALSFGASREGKAPGEITGTIAALAYAADVLTISIEITACGSGLRPDEYLYQIQSTQEHTVDGETEYDDTIEVSGTLILERRTVAAQG